MQTFDLTNNKKKINTLTYKVAQAFLGVATGVKNKLGKIECISLGSEHSWIPRKWDGVGLVHNFVQIIRLIRL